MSMLITRATGTYDYVTPTPITVDWDASETGEGYPQLPGVSIISIFSPVSAGNMAFNHGVIMGVYQGKIFMSWAMHPNGEGSSGMHALCSTSQDNAITWTAPIVACPPMDDQIGGLVDIAPGRINFGSDFVEALGSFWFLSRVQDSVDVSRTNIGVTASRWNGSGFDDPIWVYANINDGVAPSPISGYPAYQYGDPSTVAAIRLAAQQVSKFWVNGMPIRNSFFGTEELTEQRNDRMPKPNNSIIYCQRNSAGVDTSRKYFQIAYDQRLLSTSWKSGIPDVVSRSFIRRISNTLVYVGNPEPHDGIKRNPLAIGFGTMNGNNLRYKVSNIYNLFFPNPTPAIRFPGMFKLEGPQYPEILQAPDGTVLVGFSLGKEDIQVARFNMPTIN